MFVNEAAIRGFLGSRLGFVSSVLALKLALDFAYVFYLSDVFGDHFLTPFPLRLSEERVIESYLWVLCAAAILPYGVKTISGSFFSVALLFLYVPLATMVGMDQERSRLTLALTASALAISFFVSALKLPMARVPVPVNGRRILSVICWSGVAYFIVLSALTGALFRMNFDVTQMYIFREEHDQLINAGGLGYLNLWVQKVFTPLLFAIALHKRSWVSGFICVFLFIVFFGVTQHRSHLFVPLLIVLVWYLFHRNFTFAFGFFSIALGVLLSTLLSQFVGSQEFSAVMLRRAFFVGASVTDSWVSFFGVNPHVYYSDNLFSGVISNRYSGENIPHYLGDYFRPGLNLSFNAGFVATGYAHANIFGVLIYAAVLGFFVRAVNAIIRSGVPAFMPVAVLILPIRVAWVDSDLMTALLSHGLFLALILLWLYGGHSNSRKGVIARRQVRVQIV